MRNVVAFEFDTLVAEISDRHLGIGQHSIPAEAFDWLQQDCLRRTQLNQAAWLRLTQKGGRMALQLTSFAGVIRTPSGFQIEVLPKIGRMMEDGHEAARALLIDMLCCLPGFRHIKTANAKLKARKMPLIEVFIAEFLQSVENVVKHGLRSAYSLNRDNLPFLRGKLLMTEHMRRNMFRADRFFTEHDIFTQDRAENRLIHTALSRALTMTTTQDSQKLARELRFVFADVPTTTDAALDFQRVHLDRSMGYYADALGWARLILAAEAPLPGKGEHDAPSLLFPMETLFEAFVAKFLAPRLNPSCRLKAQSKKLYLVQHKGHGWFRLKPDMLVCQRDDVLLVLDTKWKLLDAGKSGGAQKYGLSQADMYQLQAYGHAYLRGKGDVVLIYPKTATFSYPLEPFIFTNNDQMTLWVLPFCLKTRQLIVPETAQFRSVFAEYEGESRVRYAAAE
jgi:5-methylcytosine-specific restriction enzyme subunit McrC